MCPNIWENENENQQRYIRYTKELFINSEGKKVSNLPLKPYVGAGIFNDMLQQVQASDRAYNYITERTTQAAIQQCRLNGLFVGPQIRRSENGQEITQWTSPKFSEVFLIDGRVGYVIDKNLETQMFTALVIDPDYVIRKYAFDRTKNVALGFCLITYQDAHHKI